MRINEICLKTGLTKKAISYYEKQGLINPVKGDNSYRDYTDNEVRMLKEIALYRKLDISIREIRDILKSDSKRSILDKIILDKHQEMIRTKIQQKYLERLLKSDFRDEEIDLLNEEVSKEEKENGQFIKNELRRSFPSGLGVLLSNHFAPFLNEPVDTVEKYSAWLNIVEFLDAVEDIEIPKDILCFYESVNYEMLEQASNNSINELFKLTKADDKELEEFKRKLLEHLDEANVSMMIEEMNHLNSLKQELNKFFNSSGYYDVFIPNMKVLSKDYSEFLDKLTALDKSLTKELGIKYDENMNIVKITD